MHKIIDLTTEQVGRKRIEGKINKKIQTKRRILIKKIVKLKQPRILTDAERGWLEGVIDGEGCICLHKHFVKNNRFQWIISLAIANTNLDLCKRVNKSIDGSIFVTPENKEMNQKEKYTFNANRKSIKLILPQLKLTVKEKQRRLILQALVLSDNITYIKEGHNLVRPKEHDEKMEEIYQKMKILNKRGVIEKESTKEKIKRESRIVTAKHTRYIRKRFKKILNDNSLNCDRKIEMIKKIKIVNPNAFINVIRDKELHSKWIVLANGYMDKNKVKFNKK
jgi:Fe2+ or Zn2+ uptake regulation protein